MTRDPRHQEDKTQAKRSRDRQRRDDRQTSVHTERKEQNNRVGGWEMKSERTTLNSE